VNIQEAIELYVGTLSDVERQQLLQREVTTMTLEVQIA
jgi:predicted RNase H-like HicB family nuclease